MKFGITLWNVLSAYDSLCPRSFAQSCRKFSQVFGTTSLRSSIVILPTRSRPIATSKKTRGSGDIAFDAALDATDRLNLARASF